MDNIDYTVKNDWGSGFTAELSIKNTSNTIIDDWTLQFQSPHRITKIWNADVLFQEGDLYAIAPKDWNDEISIGETVSFGFKAKSSGASTSRNLSEITFNQTSAGNEAANLPEAGQPQAGQSEAQPSALADASKSDALPPLPRIDELTNQDHSPAAKVSPTPSTSQSSAGSTTVWSGGFADDDWLTDWGVNSISFGEQNLETLSGPPGKFDNFLRVHYPAGSYINSAAKRGAPVGGTQFATDLDVRPEESMRLSYYVRFSDDFDFVKGGKLPGLYGGDPKSGGDIPDGTDGFSTRFMWRRDGDGEVYAYLPTSKKFGTSLGRGKWDFEPGVWHKLEQEVSLNQPGKQNGKVRVWLDDKLVLKQENLTFRTSSDLKIDGVFFSTFFGGGDPSWATPSNTHADFANFKVSVPASSRK